MTSSKERSRIKLPKDLERATVDSIPVHAKEFEYDKCLAQDFEQNRAEYYEVELHGVPVKVKVKAKL